MAIETKMGKWIKFSLFISMLERKKTELSVVSNTYARRFGIISLRKGADFSTLYWFQFTANSNSFWYQKK